MMQRHRSAGRIGAAITVAAVVGTCALLHSRPVGDRGDSGVIPMPLADRLVDVNVAGAEELALLPGIGPSIAKRIVSDRLERGPFASVDELRRVKGIGGATLDRVRPFATAGQAT